ncbi:MAG: tetratricopeptide repeat protein [Pseudomonadota bacterium]
MKYAVLSALLLTCLPAAAAAQSGIIIGEGKAQSCYQSALMGDMGSVTAVRTCTEALDDPRLVRRDQAATLANRGLLFVRRGNFDRAMADFDRALDFAPELAEAHLNRGTALFHRGDFAAARDAYTRSLELGITKEAEALYNRALAHERLDDNRAAYLDLRRTLELRPDWDAAQATMARFTVVSRRDS